MATLTGEECKCSQLESDDVVRRKIYNVLSNAYGANIPQPTGKTVL